MPKPRSSPKEQGVRCQEVNVAIMITHAPFFLLLHLLLKQLVVVEE